MAKIKSSFQWENSPPRRRRPAPETPRYLTRQSPGIELVKENDHDECYSYQGRRGRAGGGEAWKLDVGAECNTLLRLATISTAATAATLRSIVQRVAEFEELETES